MNFKILAIGFFFVAFAVNLNAQDSPNGIPVEPDDPIAEQTYWNRTGNPLFVGSGNKLGSTNAFPIQIVTSNTPRIFVTAAGMVGINTTAPLQKLHIMDGNILISRSRQGKGSSELGSTNGTLYFGDIVSASHPYGKWGIEYVSSEEEGYGLNFWKPAVPGQMHGNHFLFLADNGKVGIGTKDPQAKLAVNGDVLAKEVRVSIASTNWPDYVFSSEYEMMSLGELEKYINEHRHLPGVPSAAEVGERGDFDLGAMNAILLQKIEEMTLRMIEMEKRMQELEKNMK